MNRWSEKMLKGIQGLLVTAFMLMNAVPAWSLGLDGVGKAAALAGLTAQDGGVKLNQFASAQEDLSQLIAKVASGETVNADSSELLTHQVEQEAADIARQIQGPVKEVDGRKVATFEGKEVDLTEHPAILAAVTAPKTVVTDATFFGPSTEGAVSRLTAAPAVVPGKVQKRAVDVAFYKTPGNFLTLMGQLQGGSLVDIALYGITPAQFFAKANRAMQLSRDPRRFYPGMAGLKFIADEKVLADASLVYKTSKSQLDVQEGDDFQVTLQDNRPGSKLIAALEDVLLLPSLAANAVVTNWDDLMSGKVRQAQVAEIKKTEANYAAMVWVDLGD